MRRSPSWPWGAGGKSLIKSVLLGSASRNVLRYGNTHLLIMRYRDLEGADLKEHCEKIFAKVLFPTDFSQPAEAALSFLKGLPEIGELLLLNVVSKGETEEEIEANVAQAKEKIDELLSELSKEGMIVTSRVWWWAIPWRPFDMKLRCRMSLLLQ